LVVVARTAQSIDVPSAGRRREFIAFWDALNPIASAHAESMAMARHNRYLWDQALSSVCPMDLDLLALTVGGLRIGVATGLGAPEVSGALKTTVDIATALDPPRRQRRGPEQRGPELTL
jgi:hypothetical protein